MYVLIPIEGRFSLKTGLGYEQKGWKARSADADSSDDIRHEYTIATLLHTIHIPLQICYTIRKGKALSYAVAGGMSYNVFYEAENEWTIDTYHRERFLQTQTLYWNPTIALVPDDSRFKNSFDNTSFYRFNTAFRAEASIIWKSRYSLDIFWERGLQQIFASAGNTASQRLGYSGIALGINLR